MTLVLGFDIERSGGGREHHTIGIGASVVNDKFEELDSLFLPAHIPGRTRFESRCWDEFWCKHEDILKTLEFKATADIDAVDLMERRQSEIIHLFQEFRRKWESLADTMHMNLELASDNKSFDVCFLNEMIFEYCQDGTSQLPMPYTASLPQKYQAFSETHSMQRGLLLAVDPAWTKKGGCAARIAELYNVPAMKKKHDHNPANDAYTIAFEAQVLYAIRDGRIQKNLFTTKDWPQ